MSVSLYYIFNIQSITKTEEKLEKLLMHFPCTPTIIALSETNLNPNKLNKINIDGFKFVFRIEFLTYGGFGLCIDKNISTIQDDLNLLCNKCKNVWIKISLKERKIVVVGIIYRHSGYDLKKF